MTLVGIVNADLGLHMPDFRAGERTFSSSRRSPAVPVAEMSAANFSPTFTPHSPSIQFARHHDFEGFWDQESSIAVAGTITLRAPRPCPGCSIMGRATRRDARPPPGRRTAAGVLLGEPAPRRWRNRTGSIGSRHAPSKAVVLSRHLRSVLDKLPFPEDVIVTVDVDAYQLL